MLWHLVCPVFSFSVYKYPFTLSFFNLSFFRRMKHMVQPSPSAPVVTGNDSHSSPSASGMDTCLWSNLSFPQHLTASTLDTLQLILDRTENWWKVCAFTNLKRSYPLKAIFVLENNSRFLIKRKERHLWHFLLINLRGVPRVNGCFAVSMAIGDVPFKRWVLLIKETEPCGKNHKILVLWYALFSPSGGRFQTASQWHS